ncbi:GFA family protein, partial [Stenotrophomonas maltophilia]
TSHFNNAHIDQHHCRECGIDPYSEAVDPRSGMPMVAVYVRCVPAVDLASLAVTSYVGAAL